MKTTLIRHAALAMAGSLGLFAQNAPLLKHSTEINGFLGYSYGIDEQAGNPSRVIGGGTLSYSVTKIILPYFEFGYFPGIGRTLTGSLPSTGASYTASFNVPLMDIHGGVHLRIPIKESPLVPYVVLGVGVLRASETQYNYSIVIPNVSTPLTGTATAPSTSAAAVNFGGGFRYYIGRHAGVRLEGKAYHATGDLKNTFGKLEGGFFLQFGGTR